MQSNQAICQKMESIIQTFRDAIGHEDLASRLRPSITRNNRCLCPSESRERDCPHTQDMAPRWGSCIWIQPRLPPSQEMSTALQGFAHKYETASCFFWGVFSFFVQSLGACEWLGRFMLWESVTWVGGGEWFLMDGSRYPSGETIIRGFYQILLLLLLACVQHFSPFCWLTKETSNYMAST